MNQEDNVSLYEIGNNWQKKVYKKMSNFLSKKENILYGKSSKGNYYNHLLDISCAKENFINEHIYEATNKRINSHKIGDINRLLTNTAASQPYCFNLIAHLQQNPELADKLFSNLFDKHINIVHLEPEFTPNECNSIKGFERNSNEDIGDQSSIGGTDADIAVFYKYDGTKKGILLIEFKFIEAEFSICSSFNKKKEIRSICNSANFFDEMVTNKKANDSNNYLCGYNKYENWVLTNTSNVIDNAKVKVANSCPFMFGLNQLWRNFLLAEKIAKARDCDEFGFWVFSPKENDEFLWNNNKTEKEFRDILTEQGNSTFKKIYLETVFENLEKIVSNQSDKDWLKALDEKYNIKY